MKKFKLRNFRFKEFSLMLVVVFLAGFGSILLTKSFWYVGTFLLLGSFGLEYFLLTRIDTREEIKKTKEEIEDLVDKAEEATDEIEEAKNDINRSVDEIQEMKRKIFGFREPFFTVGNLSSDLNEIKEHIGLNYGWAGSSSTLKERIDRLERILNKVVETLKIR